MVVYHDDVKLEVCFLSQGTLHGISHGLFAVEDGDDDRCLVFKKILLTEVGLAVVRWCLSGPTLLKCWVHAFSISICTSLLRVHIVKLLLAILRVSSSASE